MPHLSRFLLPLLVGLFLGPTRVRAADPPTEPADIIRTFEKAWVVPKGYMGRLQMGCGYSSLVVCAGSRLPCRWEAGVLTARTPNPAFSMARRT